MEIRTLERADGETIRTVARRSMESAYDGLIPAEVIREATAEWYADEEIATYVETGEMDFVIAEIDGEVVGFAQAHVVDDLGKGRILWVHVLPDHRGTGIGSDLLSAAIDRLHDRGIESVTAVVLAEHERGRTLYETSGFQKLAEREVEIAEETFREFILREEASPEQPLELRVDDTGRELYVDLAETDRGTLSPFCPVYEDPDRTHRFGWFCTACESLKTAMDPMGRIECSACENTRRPTRWDAAYL